MNKINGRRVRRFSWLISIIALLFGANGALAAITFKEAVATRIGTPPTISATLTQNQAAGDFIVVIIGWGVRDHTITSVTDSRGNTYASAVGPTISYQGNMVQSIYYAKNVVAATGTNVVTVTFSSSLITGADLRVASYSGVDKVNPIDAAGGNTGYGTSITSSSISTANANDLIVAGDYQGSGTASIGSGFTSRVMSNQNQFLADKIVSATGSYSITATQQSFSAWISQLVAFKAAAGDTLAPTPPGSFTATPTSSSQINLSWAASTDNVGITGYQVRWCLGSGCAPSTNLGSPIIGTTLSHTGLTGSATYRYIVRALDAAGNGADSNIVTAATPASPDIIAPTPPGSFTATPISSTQINLSWGASTDNVGVTGYQVRWCQGAGCTPTTNLGSPIAGTTLSHTGRTASTTYRYIVRAVDAAGNFADSVVTTATTPAAPDIFAPTPPGSFTATPISSTQINFSWTASTDNVGVTGYQVRWCSGVSCTPGTNLGSPVTGTTHTHTGLTGSTTYRYAVRALDAAGNFADSSVATATTSAAPDIVAPTTPTGFSATPVSSTQINLSWSPSTDNVAVTGYEVQRCLASSCTWTTIGTPTVTTWNSAGLIPSTGYRFQVRARDAVPNWGSFSTIVDKSTVSQVETVTYTYDAKGRLKQVVRNGGVNINVQSNYTYDKANNRKSVVTTGSSN